MNSPADPAAIAPPRSPLWLVAAEILLIFGVFALHGAWPVPDVNEPHYLSKAKHYWDPAWCAHDFFCNTADAHQVFYWTFGWLTKFLPLPQVAWTGRLITWGLLAWAWRRLSIAALPRPWLAVLSAALFVSLTENSHMAGEWIIGGVEAKGFSYVLVLLGFEAVLRGRWNVAWLLLGAASALHVIVGGWSTLAALVAWMAAGADRPPLVKMLPGLFGGFLLALPALVFALALTRGVDAETVQLANDIYVWKRLGHHLSAGFREGFPSRMAMLTALWLVLVTAAPTDTAQRRLRWLVSASLLFTAFGYLLVALSSVAPALATSLLRFYWFRTTDVLLPLGVPLVGLYWLTQLSISKPGAARLWFVGLWLVAAADLVYQTQHLPLAAGDSPTTVAPRADKNLNYADWRLTCDWIEQHTSPDAVFFTPRLSATLRWYANRAEVVNWKDIPQDAASIKQWAQRLADIHGLKPDELPPTQWRESLGLMTPERVNELAHRYKAQYAIVQLLPDMPRWPTKPEYENASYAVYRLPLK